MTNQTCFTFALLAFFLSGYNSFAQPGCTDPQANNYNAGATINDGSCTYNVTNTTYNTVTNLSATVNETSGLIFWRNHFWTHNDSGGPASIFSLDSTTGNVIQTVTITNATNVDWEDIAQDADFIYIGDFGNNVNGNRTNLRIYKIAKADISTAPAVSTTAEIINFSYSDQTNFTPTGSNNTDFDCEALIAKGDSLYLFSKNWINFQTRLYRLAKTSGTQTAEFLTTFNVDGLITGADYNSDCNRVVLVGYRRVLGGATFIWNLFDFPGNAFFAGNKRRIQTQAIETTGQVEGISFIDGNSVYTSRENNAVLGGGQRLFRLSVAPYLGTCNPIILPMQMLYLEGRTNNGVNEVHFKCTGYNIGHYELQKKDNGSSFVTIAKTLPRADQVYLLKDPNPLEGKNFYRIKSVDIDGKINYSSTISIVTGKRIAWTFTGNTQGATIDVPGTTVLRSQLRLFDIHGREVFQTSIRLPSSGYIHFPQKLKPGTYLATVRMNDGTIASKKLVLND